MSPKTIPEASNRNETTTDNNIWERIAALCIISNGVRKRRNLHQIRIKRFRGTGLRTTERWGGWVERKGRGSEETVATEKEERRWLRMREQRSWKRFWREAWNCRASWWVWTTEIAFSGLGFLWSVRNYAGSALPTYTRKIAWKWGILRFDDLPVRTPVLVLFY